MLSGTPYRGLAILVCVCGCVGQKRLEPVCERCPLMLVNTFNSSNFELEVKRFNYDS